MTIFDVERGKAGDRAGGRPDHAEQTHQGGHRRRGRFGDVERGRGEVRPDDLALTVVERPQAVQRQGNEAEPEPAPARRLRGEAHLDRGGERERHADAERRQREDEQPAGEEIPAPVAPLQHQQRADAGGQSQVVGDPESPQQLLPGDSEEQERHGRRQRGGGSHTPAHEHENESRAEQPEGDGGDAEWCVAGAEDRQQDLVDEQRHHYQVAVLGAQEDRQAVPATMQDQVPLVVEERHVPALRQQQRSRHDHRDAQSHQRPVRAQVERASADA